MPPAPTAAAVVLAGGSGTRVGAGTNKVFLPLAGRPLVCWSLGAFADVEAVGRLVLVVRSADLAMAKDAVAGLGRLPVEIVEGGRMRHDSEWAALRHLSPTIRSGGIDVVAVHDGARPLVGRRLIAATLAAARDNGAAVPGLPLDDVDPPGGQLVRVQTPQAFAASALLDAYEAAERDGFTGTDTAACLERYGGPPVHCLSGDARNLKVTYRRDLAVAEHLLAQADYRID